MTSPTTATKRLMVAPTRQMSKPTCARSKKSVSVLATSASYTVRDFVVWVSLRSVTSVVGKR